MVTCIAVGSSETAVEVLSVPRVSCLVPLWAGRWVVIACQRARGYALLAKHSLAYVGGQT